MGDARAAGRADARHGRRANLTGYSETYKSLYNRAFDAERLRLDNEAMASAQRSQAARQARSHRRG